MRGGRAGFYGASSNARAQSDRAEYIGWLRCQRVKGTIMVMTALGFA